MNEIKNINTEEIEFYGDKLLGGLDDEGKVWLAINKTCQSLGFDEVDSKNQAKRINSDETLKKLSVKFYSQVVSENGTIQNREMTFLSEKAITLWLAKISITKNMKEKYPELSDKLEKYQLECADVLHNHFMGTETKRDNFFNDTLGIDIESIKEQNTILINENKILNNKLENFMCEFENFRNFTETQTHTLNMLVKRFDIYENENTKYTRLVDDFNAKVNNASDKNKHKLFWVAICDWFGLDLNKLLSTNNKKQYLLNTIGIQKLEYFIDNVILDRIVCNNKGHWVNLQGFNSDFFGVEKSKVITHWIKRNGELSCCYCGEEIKNPVENIDYNFEHMIAKTQSGSTDTIENISIACCNCNKEKNSTNWEDFVKIKGTSKAFIDRAIMWRKEYEIK